MKIILYSAAILGTLFSCTTQEAVPRRTAEQIEAGEFAELIRQDSINKQQNAAESLDVLLNDDANDKRVSVIINNSTNCNIILRFAGDQFYNLPVKKNFRNFIVIEKGTYSLGANLCRARYTSSKTFTGSITLTISEGN